MPIVTKPSVAMRRQHRRGLTLVELLIVIVLLSIVVGGIMGVIVRQQQFYSGASGVLDTKSTVREGIAVMQTELRALRPQADIFSMDDTSIVFRAPRGISVVCAPPVVVSGTATIIVPPLNPASGSGLTSWIDTPEPGDEVLLYDNTNSRWIRAEIQSPKPVNAGSCTSIAAATPVGWTIRMQVDPADALALATIQSGASLRFYRTASYVLRRAADGNAYLSYYDCNKNWSPNCRAPQVVSGPYLAPDGAPRGLQFTYRNVGNAVTAIPAQVARIDIMLRSQSAGVVNMPGRPRDFYRDSLQTSIAPRNNR